MTRSVLLTLANGADATHKIIKLSLLDQTIEAAPEVLNITVLAHEREKITNISYLWLCGAAPEVLQRFSKI